MIFNELHATVLRVEDFPAMLRWYRDVLGLKVVRELPEIPMVVLDLPGPSYLCLYRTGDLYRREENPKCMLNWRTDDIEGTRQKLIGQGVECGTIMESPGFRIFRFHDPEGTVHDCCSYDERWLPEKM